MRFDLMKKHIKPTVSLKTDKKRSAVSDRPRVKRTKPIKQQTKSLLPIPSVQLDIKPSVNLDELHNIPIKQEQALSEPKSDPYIKEEVFIKEDVYIKEEIIRDLPLPPPCIPIPSPQTPPPLPPIPPPVCVPIPSPPPSIPLPDLAEEESIKTNLNAIKFEEPCLSVNADLIKIKDEVIDEPKNVEPKSLTADEIRKAEEGQAAAAMLLEQMSDVEQKYNIPLTPSPPPPPPPLPSPPIENIDDSKFSPPTYHVKREFHPEDMLTSTVQSINIE